MSSIKNVFLFESNRQNFLKFLDKAIWCSGARNASPQTHEHLKKVKEEFLSGQDIRKKLKEIEELAVWECDEIDCAELISSALENL